MNKSELKKVLKPLIKQCIKEVLFEEEGALSHIISEVANGLSTNAPKPVVSESRQQTQSPTKRKQEATKALKERKQRLLDAIGADAYGGVNIFEGTTPAPSPSGDTKGALSDVAPNDPGVDISSIFNNKSSMIFNRMMGKK